MSPLTPSVMRPSSLTNMPCHVSPASSRSGLSAVPLSYPDESGPHPRLLPSPLFVTVIVIVAITITITVDVAILTPTACGVLQPAA